MQRDEMELQPPWTIDRRTESESGGQVIAKEAPSARARFIGRLVETICLSSGTREIVRSNYIRTAIELANNSI